MTWFVVGSILLVINLWIGINDVKSSTASWRSALTWFVIGFLTFDLISQLTKLL